MNKRNHRTTEYAHTYNIASNFRDQIFSRFSELHRNHQKFCYENFLTAPLSTGLDTLKS